MTAEAKSQQETELETAQALAKEENEKRSGLGTRIRVGQTRGRNPMVISYEQFDESLPDTIPQTVESFMEVTKVTKNADLAERLWRGHNEILYTAASDPLSEFVEASWPDDAKAQFRLVVRNYSRGANVSLEEAVALIKPGFSKQFAPAA